jgi:deoxycytidylate deaminase
MIDIPYLEMQRAVDAIINSPHPINKVAASLYGEDFAGQAFHSCAVNEWPPNIVAKIGRDADIGDSSGTVHAEVNAILNAPLTGGASICVTDPICPNCAKNIAEAGIKVIYIDHKGFDKDFAKRRGGAFENMSMRICQRAGISVYELYRKDRKIIPIYEAPHDYKPHEDRPIKIEEISPIDINHFRFIVERQKDKFGTARFACSLAQSATGRVYALSALAHLAVGYEYAVDINLLNKEDSKYSFVLEPVNRLMMNAARRGLKLMSGYIYSSQVPTSREQVNMVGAGLSDILIGDVHKARDDHALKAMLQLQQADIIRYKHFKE